MPLDGARLLIVTGAAAADDNPASSAVESSHCYDRGKSSGIRTCVHAEGLYPGACAATPSPTARSRRPAVTVLEPPAPPLSPCVFRSAVAPDLGLDSDQCNPPRQLMAATGVLEAVHVEGPSRRAASSREPLRLRPHPGRTGCRDGHRVKVASARRPRVASEGSGRRLELLTSAPGRAPFLSQ
jgi:hypothetical protein